MKRALISGITGRSYLAEFLIDRGYAVHGLVRRTSQFSRTRASKASRWNCTAPN